MWKSFLKAKKVEQYMGFLDVLEGIKQFLFPIITMIKESQNQELLWN